MKELKNKKFSTINIEGKNWQYYFTNQYYDFSIYIVDPDKNEYTFTRKYFNKTWTKKIRIPFVTPELVKRYIKIFIKG